MAPVISRSNLQQSGSSPTPLAAQITVVSGGPIDEWSIQDVPPSGSSEQALSPNGASFTAGSVSLTPAQFAACMINPVAGVHQIWVNAKAGGQWSGGGPFNVTPAANPSVPPPTPSTAKPPVFKFSQSIDCLAGTVPAIPSIDVNGSAWTPSTPAHWLNSQITFQRQDHDLVGRAGKVHVLGSSGPAGCHVETWADICINRAVGGQTLAGMLNALQSGYMPSLHEARAVALVGVEINDALDPSVNWTRYQDYLGRLLGWLTGPLVFAKIWNTVTPGQRSAVAQANGIATALLASRPNCQIVDINPLICDASGNPLPGMLLDNEHLDAEGAKILRGAMQEAFGRL